MRLFCKQVSPAGDGPGVPVGSLPLRRQPVDQDIEDG
jgi:hypothetical protein